MRPGIAALLLAPALACGPRPDPFAPDAPRSLAQFAEFRYRALPGLGFCLRPGEVETATIRNQDGRMSFDWSERGGGRGIAILTDLEFDDTLELFAEIPMAPEPPTEPDDAGDGGPACTTTSDDDAGTSVTRCDFEDDVVESDDRCLLHDFVWEDAGGAPMRRPELGLSDADARRILDLLESFRDAHR